MAKRRFGGRARSAVRRAGRRVRSYARWRFKRPVKSSYVSMKSVAGAMWGLGVAAKSAFGGNSWMPSKVPAYSFITPAMWKQDALGSAQLAAGNAVAMLSGYDMNRRDFNFYRLVDGYGPLAAGLVVGKGLQMITKRKGISLPFGMGRFNFI